MFKKEKITSAGKNFIYKKKTAKFLIQVSLNFCKIEVKFKIKFTKIKKFKDRKYNKYYKKKKHDKT